MTSAWIFMRHGQRSRALALCEALREDDPRDGVAAVALAEQAEANVVAKCAVLSEGDANDRDDIIVLGNLPLFFK